MKKIFFFALEILLIFSVVSSCKKTEIKINKEQINDIGASLNDSGISKIDFNWTKMNYNMLSSLFFDIQVNPEKYNNKRFKLTGNFHTSVYEGKRYFSVLVWDPTGCCPVGLDFIPPVEMKYPEDFPEMDSRITVTCVFNYAEDEEQAYFEFKAEEIVREET